MNKKALVEAALFVSDTPLSLKKISEITNIDEPELEKILQEIEFEFSSSAHGVELVKTPEGYELRVKPAYRGKVARLAPFSDLSDGMLRSLAIIAVKQPVKQSIIVRYQGNKAYGYIEALERKGLVKTEKFGRTKLISTTPDFEKYFGKSKEEIKKFVEEKASL